MSLLSKNEIKNQLDFLDSWIYENNALKKEYIFESYMDSIHFINLLADQAEINNHHPDMTVGWCKINLLFTSHDLGGVTQACMTMAQEADKIFLRKDFF